MVAPIRKSLLIHTVLYKDAATGDGWGGEDTGGQQVERVRIEPKTSWSLSGGAETVSGSALLFWDAVYSTPCAFAVGHTVVFNGRSYKISGIDDFYAGQTLHHKELKLL